MRQHETRVPSPHITQGAGAMASHGDSPLLRYMAMTDLSLAYDTPPSLAAVLLKNPHSVNDPFACWSVWTQQHGHTKGHV